MLRPEVDSGGLRLSPRGSLETGRSGFLHILYTRFLYSLCTRECFVSTALCPRNSGGPFWGTGPQIMVPPSPVAGPSEAPGTVCGMTEDRGACQHSGEQASGL